MSDIPSTPAEQVAPALVQSAADLDRSHSKIQVLLLAVLLSVITGLLFSRSLSCEFVELDDDTYVFRNENVRNGFMPETLGWLTTGVVAGNWHPVTMATHLLDVELYGLQSWGHHLTNVLIHSLLTGLLCYVLWRMTGALWPSVVAAALFGTHPLRVESVTWVSERKDVLSVFFFMLALWAYTNYVQRGRWLDYCLMLLAATLGLMSKSMLVTLPFVLLLLDFWPLGRLEILGRLQTLGRMPTGSLPDGSSTGSKGARGRSRAARAKRSAQQRSLWQLVLEKLPLFALVVIISAVTFWAQTIQGGVRSTLPLTVRVLNAMLAYQDYLRQTIWPTSMCAYYPHQVWEINKVTSLAAGVALVLFTAFFVQQRSRHPYLLVGWLWFLGTLVPTIGLIQVGGAARADRYTYLPSVGLSIMVSWFVYDFARSRRLLPQASVAMLAIAIALSIVTWRQQAYWKNTIALAQRAIDATKANYMAHSLLGVEYLTIGQPREAIEHMQNVLKLMPTHRLAAFETGRALRELQEPAAALDFFDLAQRIGPNLTETAAWHAEALLESGRRDDAQRELVVVLRIQPDNQLANSLLARLTAAEGDTPSALRWLRDAHRNYPTQPQIAASLAWLLATHPDGAQRSADEALAVVAETKAHQSEPDFDLLQAEAAALAERGDFDAAVAVAKQAEELLAVRAGDSPRRLKQLEELRAQMQAYNNRQPWREDPRSKLPPVKDHANGATRITQPHATDVAAHAARGRTNN